MADMSDLPKGIPRKIALEHLDNLEDVESFAEVCSSWRSEIWDVNDIYKRFRPSNNTQLPWLMLTDPPANMSYRRVYSLSKGMYRKIDLPRFTDDEHDHRRYLSSKGWLIAVSMKHALITFFDPFSGTVINPPIIPLSEFEMYGCEWLDTDYIQRFSKFIFTTRDISSKYFEVAMIYDNPLHLAFWKPGQHHWIKPPHVDHRFQPQPQPQPRPYNNCQIEDVCYFRGRFYAVDNNSQVITFDPEKRPRILSNLESLGLVPDPVNLKYNIAVLGAALLVIQRKLEYTDDDDDDKYYSAWFKLFEVNVDDHDHVKVNQVRGIGNRALFLGFNSTFFVEADPDEVSPHKRGCRPNCIYISDDHQDMYGCTDLGGGFDMGIYSLDENKVVAPIYQGPSQFSHDTPPLWVELPHY